VAPAILEVSGACMTPSRLTMVCEMTFLIRASCSAVRQRLIYKAHERAQFRH
jgi:hypothetical protein